jgi:hypothetical protein
MRRHAARPAWKASTMPRLDPQHETQASLIAHEQRRSLGDGKTR